MTLTAVPQQEEQEVPAPRHELLLITPRKAAELLKRNEKNRRLTRGKVKEYAKAMKEGRWRFDAMPICISTEGRLLNGQHRLEAIIESGVPQTMSLWWNIEPAAQSVMDTGRKRSFGDALTMRGETYGAHLAATTTMLKMWEEGIRGRGLINPTIRWQIPELMDYFDEHQQEIRESVQVGRNVAANLTKISARTVAVCNVLFSRIDQGDAAEFMRLLSTGEDMKARHPVLVTRNAIQSMAADNTRVHQAYLLALVIKAWNSWRAGDEMGQAKYKMGGAAPERFPEPSAL